MIREITLAVTTAGASGSATGEATTTEGCNGYLAAVYLPTGSHANTDWVFSDPITGTTLVTFTNINTAGWYTPMLPAVTAAAGVAITDGGSLIPLTGQLKCAMAQATAGTYNILLRIERG